MIIRESRERPLPWSQRKQQVPSWSIPFFAIEWFWEWLAYVLSRWSFIEVLEYLGSLSILVAVFFYFHDADNRTKQRHYQAWQVINTAQEKGGSGGRIEALQELNNDGVPLVGVNVAGAFLQGIHLGKARLLRSDFSAADVRNSDFKAADLQDAVLHSANFRQSSLQHASMIGTQIDDADLQGADLSDTELSGATFDNSDLRFVNFNRAAWNNIRSIKGANVYGIRNPPSGFLEWALKQGAVQMQADQQWQDSRSR